MESILEEITITTIYSVIIVFCRMGSMLLVVPGIGEAYVAARFRIHLGLAISVVVAPVVMEYIPVMPTQLSFLFLIMFIEIVTGIFYGIIVRVLINVMQVAGVIISVQSGLSSAVFFDPNQGVQATVISNFYTLLAVTLFFATNLHFHIIEGIVHSYQTLPPGSFVASHDFTEAVISTVDRSFLIAFKISAPVVIISLLVLIGAGILSRLMPGIQIFFILTPAQLLISLFIILLTLSGTVMWYINTIDDYISNFFLGR